MQESRDELQDIFDTPRQSTETKKVARAGTSENTSFTQETIAFFKDLAIIILIVLFVRTFLVMPFQINGQSMYESYYNGEFILVDRLSYLDIPLIWEIRPVRRWDVVVFKPGVSKDRKYFIKRVVGLPGDTIRIQDGKVYLKNIDHPEYVEIRESWYLSDENNGHTYVDGSSAEHIYVVPQGQYFVMWDNREHSTDSRSCFQNCITRTSYITHNDIVGKVLLDLGYFSFSDFSFTQPEIGISTYPRFFSSPSTYSYDGL